MDNQITEALNQIFKDKPSHFNAFTGKNNYFKVPLAKGVAYAYIDAFRGEELV